jgi:hypothetical protein
MSRLLPNLRGLFLLCVPIVLAGCQHPLAPSVAREQPTRVNQALVDATPVAREQPTRVNQALVDATPVAFFDYAMQLTAPAIQSEACVLMTSAPESPKSKDASPVTGVQKQPACLTGQLADSLMDVFKTFTGR